MSRGAHVLALGARTPVGLNAESAAAAVHAGISRLGDYPLRVGEAGELATGASDPLLDPELPHTDRLLAMAESALAEVLQKLRASGGLLPKAHVLLALPETRPGFSEQDALRVAEALGTQLVERDVWCDIQLVGRGHAGCALGLQQALKTLAQRKDSLVIVGGVDSYLRLETLHALHAQRRLATPMARSGFPPSEGAGFLALGTESTLRALHIAPLARLLNAHTSQETKLISNDEVSRGDGLTEAVLAACSGLELPREAPGMVLCDVNGERFRSEEWGLLQLRIGDQLATSDYEAPASVWGDLGAASVPLLCMLACRSWARGYASDSRALIWAASDSGLRGAIALEQALTG